MKIPIYFKLRKDYYPSIDTVVFEGYAHLGDHDKQPCEGFAESGRLLGYIRGTYVGLMQEALEIIKIARKS